MVGACEPVAHEEPAGQASQSEAARAFRADEKLPATQADGVEAPAAQNEPAGQSKHETLPLIGWKEPGAHAAQTLSPGVAVYDPGLQSVGVVARALQRLPAGQSTHAVAPIAGWNLPVAHAAHTNSPSLAVMVPASHGVGLAAPVSHAEPAGHGRHSVAVCRRDAFEYVPLKQGSSADAPARQ